MSSFIALMRQDVVMAWRENSAGLSISFFMIAVALIPFGLGPDLKLLRDIAPGLVWVALLLAVLLSLESIFQADLDEHGKISESKKTLVVSFISLLSAILIYLIMFVVFGFGGGMLTYKKNIPLFREVV